MNRRFILLTVTLVAALLGFGGSCGTYVTAVIVSAPQQVSPGDTALIAVCSEPSGSTPVWVRYILDWGDDSADTTRDYFPTDDTVRFSHVWRRPGVYHITVVPDERARDADGKTKYIHPSEDDSYVTVVSSGHEPFVDSMMGPAYTAVGVSTRFTIIANDPDNDSLRISIDWGDGRDTTSGATASPCTVRLVHVYRSLDTVWVQAFASDKRGAFSSSDSARLIVGEAGAVFKWWTANPPGQPDFAGSPVIVNDGYGELAYLLAGDSLVTLRLFGYGPGYRAGIAEGALVGHPVFSPATGHIYIGSDVGRLYAFDSQLHLAWFYPESLTALEWGTVAVNGSQLYVGHSDDSLVHLQDNGDSVTRIGSYHLGATAVDAPAIDAAGNVYIGTDSGYLCKFDADLGLQWNLRLAPSDEVYGPVLGSDHIVYCGGGTDKLYATNTDGSQKWVWPAGSGVSRPAVASDGNVLVGTASGRFCKLNRFTGVPLWEDSIGSASFVTTPIVVQNGYLYAQNEDGVLYCLGQSTGDVIWYCDCPATVPLATRSGRARQTNDFLANPTITAGGNIVVIGSDVVYLVKGYPTRPLDPRAPWPKWQHDLYNSGNVSGGR